MVVNFPVGNSPQHAETIKPHSRHPWPWRKRPWLTLGVLLLTVAALGLSALPTGAQQSTSPTGNQGRKISLADQLGFGLRAKTKADKAFIAAVTKAVDEKRLPRVLVDSTFLWARERATRKSKKRKLRPIVYFQPGLVLRAKKLGLKLPIIYQFPSVAAPRSFKG